MLRIGKLADYALVLVEHLTRVDDVVSMRRLSDDSHIPLATVRKILLQLAHSGIVRSYRGVNGGYRLARTAEEISVADIVESLEGPIALTACVSRSTGCMAKKHCRLQSGWASVNTTIVELLSATSIADLQHGGQPRIPVRR